MCSAWQIDHPAMANLQQGLGGICARPTPRLSQSRKRDSKKSELLTQWIEALLAIYIHKKVHKT
jgi:hypothetical protein